MTRRRERICSTIRRTIAEAILSKVADPRIDPARTSITNVEIAEDLLAAKVYISVLGDEAAQRRTMEAMRHAAGYFQELVGRQIQLRYTPSLEFHTDTQFKKTLETLEAIQRVSEELARKGQSGGAGGKGETPSPGESPAGTDDHEGR
ncbi:MAG: 30S ribosome-binding factor RbfA [Planctomycetota bacterium]|nr:30S ribosome-binding factor RbfA [Planctomycetota bacterium]